MNAHVAGCGNLPSERTSLIGRRAEVADVLRLLEQPGLVTLTGPGGVGKSRIALRAARTIAGRFPDGAWLVDIGAVESAAILPHAVANTLRISDQTALPQIDVLAEFLADRHTLLMLDGCEHLLGGVTRLVRLLLAGAPRLTILATSRQGLRLWRERRLAVSPLSVPDGTPAGRTHSEHLFLDRASAVQPGVHIDRVEAGRVCRHLNGIPLAIELAARALRTLTIDELLARVEQPLTLPPDETARPARHRTLRTAVGWSHELCPPAERLLWARLSVFTGGFGLDAVTAVCGDGEPVSGPLRGLADRSILIQDRGRYRMLDTVREYGADWLGLLGEEETLRRRHLDYYLALARRCEREWCGPDQVSWYTRLTADHANLRAALDFGLASRAQAGLELAAALWPLWIAAGFAREGRHYLDRALDAYPGPSPARADALAMHGWVAIAQGDVAAAFASTARSAEIATGRTLATAIQLRGIATILAGDPAAGLAMQHDALRLHGAAPPGDTMPLMANGSVAMALTALGRPDQAITALREVRSACDARGERWFRSHIDWLLAMAEMGRGAPLAAERHAREAIAVKRDFGDAVGIALGIEMLAAAAAAEGRAERAAVLHGADDGIYRTIGKPRLGSVTFDAIRDEAEHAARKLIGDPAYDRDLAAGSALSMDEAIAYALEEA